MNTRTLESQPTTQTFAPETDAEQTSAAIDMAGFLSDDYEQGYETIDSPESTAALTQRITSTVDDLVYTQAPFLRHPGHSDSDIVRLSQLDPSELRGRIMTDATKLAARIIPLEVQNEYGIYDIADGHIAEHGRTPTPAEVQLLGIAWDIACDQPDEPEQAKRLLSILEASIDAVKDTDDDPHSHILRSALHIATHNLEREHNRQDRLARRFHAGEQVNSDDPDHTPINAQFSTAYIKLRANYLGDHFSLDSLPSHATQPEYEDEIPALDPRNERLVSEHTPFYS